MIYEDYHFFKVTYYDVQNPHHRLISFTETVTRHLQAAKTLSPPLAKADAGRITRRQHLKVGGILFCQGAIETIAVIQPGKAQ